MNGSSIAKWVILSGLGIVFIGVLIWLGSKLGIPIGKLPGDIHVQKEKTTFYFPLMTSLILSVFLTIIINLILWFFRK